MGLFKKNPPAMSNGALMMPTEFYTLCVKDYHDTAKAAGQAERDVIFIPELLQYGQQAVLWFLKNEDIQRQIPEAGSYYFVAVNTAIRCGIIFGLKWHLDFSGLQRPGYVESVMETGPFCSVGRDNKKRSRNGSERVRRFLRENLYALA